MKRLLDTYASELARWEQTDEKGTVEDFVVKDPSLIKWNRSLSQHFERGERIEHSPSVLTCSLYRPFTKQWLYYDSRLIEMMYRNATLFPKELVSVANSANPDDVQECERMYRNAGSASALINRVIDVTGAGNTGFSCLMSDIVTCLDAVQKGQCFPLYRYEKVESSPAGELDLGNLALANGDVEVTAADGTRFIRHDAITDETLSVFQAAYPDVKALHAHDVSSAKEHIFYYMYGVLHSPEYRERYATTLKKELPRIPLSRHFIEFQLAGRRLAELHTNYESVERYVSQDGGRDGRIVEEWTEGVTSNDPGRIEKMTFGKSGKSSGRSKKDDADKSRIIVNGNVTLSNVPLSAYEYKICGRSAIEWIMDQYRVKKDKASGIVNDPNEWCREQNKPRYILDLIESVTTVSLETMDIVKQLPHLDLLGHPDNWPESWSSE